MTMRVHYNDQATTEFDLQTQIKSKRNLAIIQILMNKQNKSIPNCVTGMICDMAAKGRLDKLTPIMDGRKFVIMQVLNKYKGNALFRDNVPRMICEMATEREIPDAIKYDATMRKIRGERYVTYDRFHGNHLPCMDCYLSALSERPVYTGLCENHKNWINSDYYVNIVQNDRHRCLKFSFVKISYLEYMNWNQLVNLRSFYTIHRLGIKSRYRPLLYIQEHATMLNEEHIVAILGADLWYYNIHSLPRTFRNHRYNVSALYDINYINYDEYKVFHGHDNMLYDDYGRVPSVGHIF